MSQDDKEALAKLPTVNVQAKLNQLFDEVPHPDGRPYSAAEVADAIKKRHPNVQVSDAYLRSLRRGAKKNPDFTILAAIAEFFQVPPTFWLEEKTKKTEAQILAARLANNHGVRTLATRAHGLNPDNLAAVLAVVDTFLTQQEKTMGLHEQQPDTTM
jgi:transcriptional regulator with XRE-family HTH domain